MPASTAHHSSPRPSNSLSTACTHAGPWNLHTTQLSKAARADPEPFVLKVPAQIPEVPLYASKEQQQKAAHPSSLTCLPQHVTPCSEALGQLHQPATPTPQSGCLAAANAQPGHPRPWICRVLMRLVVEVLGWAVGGQAGLMAPHGVRLQRAGAWKPWCLWTNDKQGSRIDKPNHHDGCT